MASIEQSITVDVPVREAYDQWTQFEEFPEFMEHVEHVRQLDTTSLRWKVSIGDADRTFDATVTEQVPDQRIAWKADGESRHAGVVTFHHLDEDHTKIMLQMDIEPTDWVEKVGDFVGAYSTSVTGDLERFKDLIEERGASSGAWRGTITRHGEITQPDGSTSHVGDARGGRGSTGQLASTDDTVTRDAVVAEGGGSRAQRPLTSSRDARTER